MNNIFKILLICLVLFTSACVSLPSVDKMQKDIANFTLPKLPENGKAIVYVVRPSSMARLIRFNIFVDSKEAKSEVGYTRGKQYIYFNIEPGQHKIFSKAENWAIEDINVKMGDILFIKQNPTMGIVIARNSLNKIPEYEGKYHVKHLSLGTVK